MEDKYCRPLLFTPPDSSQESRSTGNRRHLFTIKVGALTEWIRDILAIIALWKIIAVI